MDICDGCYDSYRLIKKEGADMSQVNFYDLTWY